MAGTEPPDLESAACRLDAAAQEYLRRIEPIVFRLAISEQERQAAFHLRYEAVIAQGWGSPAAFPAGLESEPDDERADHLVGWLGDEAVASCRQLFPEVGGLLPIETAFDLRIVPLGRAVQVDRICVIQGGGERNPRLMIALIAANWLALRKRGYSVCAGLGSESMLRRYRWLGIEHEVLAPPKELWSEMRYPVRFSPLCVRPRFYDRMNQHPHA